MDVKLINPFIAGITGVMNQLGFVDVQRTGLALSKEPGTISGVVINLGIVGDKKGSVTYCVEMEGAKKIASTMMMGMPVETLDDMARSALSELSNMITANATINLSNDGVNVDISVPTLLYGEGIRIDIQKENNVAIDFQIDGIGMNVFIVLS